MAYDLEQISITYTDVYNRTHEARFDIIDMTRIQRYIDREISVYDLVVPTLICRRFDVVRGIVENLAKEGWIFLSNEIHI